MAIFISDDEANQLISIAECIDVLETVFKQDAEGLTQNLPIQRLSLQNGMLRSMMGRSYGLGKAGLRVFGARATNVSYVWLFDADSGALEAVIDTNYASALRTGATTGIATKYMAPAGADTLGVIGAGYQARWQIEAIAAVRSLRLVKVFSRTRERRDAFAAEMTRRLGIKVTSVGTPEEAVRGSAIVTTITNSRTPVIDGAWLESGVHVNAAGTAGEIDSKTARRSGWTVVDNVEQALGDLTPLLRSRAGEPFDATLAAVVAGKVPGRPSDSAITLFISRGMALEDVAACSVILERAKERGIGTKLPF